MTKKADGPELDPDKLAAAITKTGIPLELAALETVEALQWSAIHNPSYLDSDPRTLQSVERDGDVLALRHELAITEDPSVFVSAEMWIECKYNLNEWWVFFNLSDTPISAFRYLSVPRTDDAATQAIRGGLLRQLLDDDERRPPITIATRTVGRNHEPTKEDSLHKALRQVNAQIEAAVDAPHFGTIRGSPATLNTIGGVLCVNNPPIVASRDPNPRGFRFQAVDWLVHNMAPHVIHVVTTDGLTALLATVDEYLGQLKTTYRTHLRTAVDSANARDAYGNPVI